MTTVELVAQFRQLQGSEAQEFLSLLASDIYDIRLNDGVRICDVSDFALLLEECIEQLRGVRRRQLDRKLAEMPPPEQERWKEAT